PSLELDQVPLVDVLNLLNQRSVELDFAESDPNLKGINVVLDVASFGAGEAPEQIPVTLNIANVPMGVALKYVTQLTGTTFQVDNFAIRVVYAAA
ncbi:MAG: hypothetical protein P1V20_30405, partial [Verrucomicrobiales bacterium]|nr:hypothetical protein [Verrucomicrobiales bacterium]